MHEEAKLYEYFLDSSDKIQIFTFTHITQQMPK